MAMSRSFGGTSTTSSPAISTSPSLTSSSPAIMRSVVLLPQPDGPTSTTNSLSAMSRSMPRTANVSSYFFISLRSVTWAMTSSSFGRARRQAGDVVIHQKRVDHERRRGAEQRPGHDLGPGEDVAADQRGDDADRQHQLVDRGGEGERIEELRPRHGEGEDGRRDDAGQRHRHEDLGEDLQVAGA